MAVMNGVKQWIFQRTANVFLVLFGVLLLVTFFNGLTYDSMQGLLGATWFKIFALITLLLGCANSILASWQIMGDYAKKFHLPETLMNVIVILVTAVFFVTGLSILF